MKNLLVVLILFLVSCVPDEYYVSEQVEVGRALMISLQGFHEMDTLYCIRTIRGNDTMFFETGCVDNRLTLDPKDSKDTIYRTYPWPLIRFEPDPKAVSKLEKCGGPR